MFTRSTRTAKPARTVLRLEALEAREVPAILIQLDYSHDVSGFFNNPEARATMEQVASDLGNSLDASLAAITPAGGNTWTATFFDPATGGQTSVSNLSIGANTIKVFVGARSMSNSEAGFGGYGGFSPWGGSVTFDTTQNWYFGSSASGLASNQLDFYSVATHELGHVLGIGTAPQWKSLVSDGAFHGGGAVSVYGGAVPVNAAGDHWADGLTLNGQSASLDPSLAYGRRVTFSALDSAALNDLGWGSGSVPAASSPGASVTPTVTLVPVAGTDGTIKQYAVINGTVVATGAVYSPFPGYRGQFQTAYADFDHDGTFDVAVATTGPGLGIIAVISGADGHYIGGPVLSLGGVAVMVAADINGDGNAELITAEGTPLGIYVYNVTGGTIAPDVAFSAFGTPGRAALTTSGEVDRTGYGDVVSTDPSARTNTTTSTDAPKAPVESDTGANAPAPYTVSADPAKKGCSCPLCRGLSQLPGADAQPAARTAAWQDDLLSTIPVA